MKIRMYPQKRGTLVSLGDTIKWMQAVATTFEGEQEAVLIDALVAELVDLATVARRAAGSEYEGRM